MRWARWRFGGFNVTGDKGCCAEQHCKTDQKKLFQRFCHFISTLEKISVKLIVIIHYYCTQLTDCKDIYGNI